MKKYFLSIVALAGMLFATSCQESLVEPQIDGATTFTIEIPGQMGTKAIGDAGNVNKLFVQVYQDINSDPLYSVQTDVNDGKAKLQISLIQDQTYNIIFWAQKDDAYVTTNLRSIPMNANHHNNESGAAFFHYEEGFVPTGAAMAITLKRPFAQLNLGTTTESLTTNLGTIDLTGANSKVVVSNIAESFNTVKGYGEGEQTITFDAKVLPIEPLSVSGNTYKYISMDYLPIAGDDQAVVTVKAEINITGYDVIAHEFTNVPVKENYRTNIVGNLISSTSDFIITVDDRFVDENENLNPDNDYLVVDNVCQAQVAFAEGETHVAINSIGNTQTLQLPDNGKELYLQLPDSDGTITIERNAGRFNISVPDTNPSNTGLTIIIEASNSTVDFTGQATVIYSTTASNTLNLSGANVGTIFVKKGNVVVENESTVEGLKNQSNAEVTVYVDRTSTVEVPENENFNKVEAPVKIESLEDLQKVLTYSASDVIELPNAITNTENFKLNLNGKTVTAVDNATGSYAIITNKGNLTVNGPGKISLTATNNRNWNAYSSVISNTVGGNLTVQGGVVIEHLGGTDMAYGIDNLTNGKGTSAIATINYATVKSTYRAVRQFLNGVEADNTLTVNSGAVIEGANKSIWMQDPSANANTGTLLVKEGATLKGDVYLYVCAGSTEWPVSVSIADSTVKGEVLTGNVPAGYEVVCENGVWIVKWSPKSENFAENTWEDIIKACQNNVVPESWKVGDIKTMKIGDYTYEIAIIGKNHDTYTGGTTKAPLTFQLFQLYGTDAQMNETQDNTTGWSGSKMRNTTMGEILSAMPDEVKNAIKAVDKVSLNGTKSALETTSDKLFLLSEKEVNGSEYYSGGYVEGTRYAYYADQKIDSKGNIISQIMKQSPNKDNKWTVSWFLRTPKNRPTEEGYQTRFIIINGSGYMSANTAEIKSGVVFGFCF